MYKKTSKPNNKKTIKKTTKKNIRGGESQGFIKPLAYMTFNLIEKGGTVAIQELGRVLGVDTNNTDIKEVLKKMNTALEDPETKRELALFLVNMGDNIIIAADALAPPMQSAIDKILDIFDRGAKRVIQVATSAGLEAATALPVVGSALGGIIVIDDMVKLGEAALSTFLGTTTTGVETATDVRNNIITKTNELANERKKMATGNVATGNVATGNVATGNVATGNVATGNVGVEMSNLRGLKEKGQARLNETISGLRNTDSFKSSFQNAAEKIKSQSATLQATAKNIAQEKQTALKGAAMSTVNPATVLKQTQALNKQALAATKGLTKELPLGQRLAANTALNAASLGANVTARGAAYAANKIANKKGK